MAIYHLNLLAKEEKTFYDNYRRFATLQELRKENSRSVTDDMECRNSHGYCFEIDVSQGGYVVKARPNDSERSARRTFYSDQTGQIRAAWLPDIANRSSSILE